MLFAYEGAPLGQIAYVGADGVPVLFGVIKNASADAALATQEREGLAMTFWAHGGRGYMVVARLPEDRIRASPGNWRNVSQAGPLSGGAARIGGSANNFAPPDVSATASRG